MSGRLVLTMYIRIVFCGIAARIRLSREKVCGFQSVYFAVCFEIMEIV